MNSTALDGCLRTQRPVMLAAQLLACWEQKQAELRRKRNLDHDGERPCLTFAFINKTGIDSHRWWAKMWYNFRYCKNAADENFFVDGINTGRQSHQFQNKRSGCTETATAYNLTSV